MGKDIWYVYVLECSDFTLYTGCTNSLENRLKKHNEGKGAKYTRSRLPVVLAYFEQYGDKREAMQREAKIKKLSRKQKLNLIKR